MTRVAVQAPRVAWVGMYLDPLGRAPDELVGGGWREYGMAAAAARHAGVQVAVVQAGWQDAERAIDGVSCSFVRERGRPVLRLPGGATIRRHPRRLLARVAALAPEVIHYEGLVLPRALRALATALPGVPILAQDHASKCPRGWRRRWLRWGLAPLAGVVFTARSQAQPFIEAGVLRPGIRVFEAIEVSTRFTPGDPHTVREAIGLDGDPCLLWVGHLDANKDPLMVLDAVARAAVALPALRLHMCFLGAPLLGRVRERLRADPILAGRVRLVGAVPHAEMERYFRAADFLVQGSHDEGSGFALIEALACGTTPLVTDIAAFRRIVGQGEAGALVPVGDAAALAAAIGDWAGRDRAELRRRARAWFDRDLSYEAMGGQLRAAYQALWQGTTGSARTDG